MASMRTVCFLLPDRLDRPVGGHKVVYQYANHLSSHGFAVIIANNFFRPSACNFLKESARKIYSLIRYWYRLICHKNTCRGWFNLDASIKEISVWDFHKSHMPKAEFYVATNAVTAPFLLEYNTPNSNKIYFIQGFETWLVSEKTLLETYQLPVKKVAVANSLATIVKKHCKECSIVRNGYDSSEFFLQVPLQQKNKYSISMLYHTMATKNCSMAFQAFDIVKKSIPSLKIVLFGVPPQPKDLPLWYDYYQMPNKETHNRINNECAIYVGPSSSEGFGLTILEAMACGQAVACTDNDGYKEIAENGVNSLISPIGDAIALSSNILRLIQDDNLRFNLANAGYEKAKQYDIYNSCRSFEAIFRNQ